jgi:ionotropic glutamate receptor
MPPQCNGKPQSGGSKKKKLSPLSLKNLTSAFIVLFVGLIFSFLTFLGENIISIRK